MHELSLCQSILGIVDRARAGRAVEVVELRVGQLRQVVPETLVFCWGLVTEGTGLEGSRLEVDHIPVRLSCRSCGTETEVAHALVLTCGGCGSGDIAVLKGEEMEVTSLRLAPAAPTGTTATGAGVDGPAGMEE